MTYLQRLTVTVINLREETLGLTVFNVPDNCCTYHIENNLNSFKSFRLELKVLLSCLLDFDVWG